MTVSDTLLQSLIYVAVHTQERAQGDRPWDEAGVHVEVRRLRDEGLSGREIAQRTLGHAWNPKSRTPAALRWPAEELQPAPGPANPDRVLVECPLHPGKPAGRCVTCAADALAGEPPRSHAGRRLYDPETGERLRHRPLRELVAEATDELLPLTTPPQETR